MEEIGISTSENGDCHFVIYFCFISCSFFSRLLTYSEEEEVGEYRCCDLQSLVTENSILRYVPVLGGGERSLCGNCCCQILAMNQVTVETGS